MLVIERKTSVFTEIESYSLPIQLKSFHWFIINERALSQELCMLLISDRLRSPICRINLLSHFLNPPKQRMTDKFPSPPILIATPFPASFTWIARLKQNVNKSITNRFSLIKYKRGLHSLWWLLSVKFQFVQNMRLASISIPSSCASVPIPIANQPLIDIPSAII